MIDLMVEKNGEKLDFENNFPFGEGGSIYIG